MSFSENGLGNKEKWADLVDDIEWHGYTFPQALGNDGSETNTPEAYPCHEGLLPHQHSKIDSHFPFAVACDPSNDNDPPTDDLLEQIGIRKGFDGDQESLCRSQGDTHGEDSSGNHRGAPANSSYAGSIHSSLEATRARRQHDLDQEFPVEKGFVRLRVVAEEDGSEEE